MTELSTSCDTSAPAQAAGEEFAPRPRLSIFHLLAWTFATAVLLAIDNWRRSSEVSGDVALSEILHTYLRVGRVISRIVSGAAIVGGATVTIWWIRGGIRRLWPGEILLVSLAGTLIGSTTIGVTFTSWRDAFFGEEFLYAISLYLLAHAIVLALLAAMLLGAAVYWRRSLAWLIAFIALALAVGGHACAQFVDVYRYWAGLAWFEPGLIQNTIWPKFAIETVTIAAVVLVDLLKRRRMSGAHWLGIVLYYLTSLIMAAFFAAIWFLNYS